MKSINIYLIISLFSISISAQEQGVLEKASSLLEGAVAEGHVNGISGGILLNDSIVWSDAKGYSNVDAKAPFSIATSSRIASIAKPMTAIAILQLVENGKISLDDKIGKHLPQFKNNKSFSAITVRHLLQHSSGIPHYKNRKEVHNTVDYKNFDEVIEVFIDRKLLFEPGAQFEYSVYGYILLGRLIEEVSDLGYERYMKKHIWDVAGMQHTRVENRDKAYPNKAVSYHQSKPGKIDIAKSINLSNRIPAGGIESSAEDLLKFAHAILNHKLISKESLDLMSKNYGLKKQGNGYGLGWYLYGKNPLLGDIIGHNGGQYGCTSFLMIAPEHKAAAVVLSSTSGAMQQVSNIEVTLLAIAAKLKSL